MAAISGQPDRLLLCGGMKSGADLCADVWASHDAGRSWAELARPGWVGRYRAALRQLPGTHDGEARLLILGGCFIDGGGGGYGGLERLLHDAWEARLDLSCQPVDQHQLGAWTSWNPDVECRGEIQAVLGIEEAAVDVDANCNCLVARLPCRDFVSVADARKLPDPAQDEYMRWLQVSGGRKGVAGSVKRSVVPHLAASEVVYVRIFGGSRLGLPRLVLFSVDEAWASGAGEWRRQARFTLLLGLRLELYRGLPRDIWRERVLPAVLPTPPRFVHSGIAAGSR